MIDSLGFTLELRQSELATEKGRIRLANMDQSVFHLLGEGALEEAYKNSRLGDIELTLSKR